MHGNGRAVGSRHLNHVLEIMTMELTENQAALILEATEEGDITVNVSMLDPRSLSGALCQAIAWKLTNDEEFQSNIFDMLEEE